VSNRMVGLVVARYTAEQVAAEHERALYWRRHLAAVEVISGRGSNEVCERASTFEAAGS
jgi:hypothetical protein